MTEAIEGPAAPLMPSITSNICYKIMGREAHYLTNIIGPGAQ